jgi:MFS family permease
MDSTTAAEILNSAVRAQRQARYALWGTVWAGLTLCGILIALFGVVRMVWRPYPGLFVIMLVPPLGAAITGWSARAWRRRLGLPTDAIANVNRPGVILMLAGYLVVGQPGVPALVLALGAVLLAAGLVWFGVEDPAWGVRIGAILVATVALACLLLPRPIGPGLTLIAFGLATLPYALVLQRRLLKQAATLTPDR